MMRRFLSIVVASIFLSSFATTTTTVVAAAAPAPAASAEFDGTTTSTSTIIKDNDAVRFLVTVPEVLDNEECEEQMDCKNCFDASPDCSWTVISDKSGNFRAACSNLQCLGTIDDGTRTRNLSEIVCDQGVSAEKRKKLKMNVWKKRNKHKCNRLPKTCGDQSRAGNCINCLSSKHESIDQVCAWTGSCQISCNVIADKDCVKGSLPRKGARKECKRIEKDNKYSAKCSAKSDTNCNECTSTTFNKGEASCRWFPTNNGGHCDSSKCNILGCGESSETCDLPPIGTEFPEYGPPFDDDFIFTGNAARDQLSKLYPGLKIYIIEYGSYVTTDLQPGRVRIWVVSNDDDDDDDNLGERDVFKIPRVG